MAINMLSSETYLEEAQFISTDLLLGTKYETNKISNFFVDH